MNCFFSLLSILIQINQINLNVEVAQTQAERAKGLMYRENLAEGNGMLFIFEKETALKFWMKNTKIPLSIAFFDKNCVLVNMEDMDPYVGISKSLADCQYALEVPLGWYKKNGIEKGMKFSFLNQVDEIK